MKKIEKFDGDRTVEFSKTSASAIDRHEFLKDISRECAKEIVDFIFKEAKADPRIIAVGGGDLEIGGWFPFVNPPEKTETSMWIPVVFQEMLFSLITPKSILVSSLDMECNRIHDTQKRFGSKVTTINNKHLLLFEKFMKPKYGTFDDLTYEVIDLMELEKSAGKFDYITLWNMDIENQLISADEWLNLLAPGGVLVLQNVSDANFLYVEKTHASGIWEFHEDIKNREDCNMYHVPLYYGFTIIKKNPIQETNWNSYYKFDYSGNAA